MGSDTKESYQEKLEALKTSLAKQVMVLRADLHTAETNLQAVVTTMNLVRGGVAETEVQADDYIRGFRGLTQVQALIKLAQDNGTNRFRIADAKRLLISAGLIKSKKNASNILYNAIQRSEKFERVAPGEYQLILKPVIASSGGIQMESLKRVESVR